MTLRLGRHEFGDDVTLMMAIVEVTDVEDAAWEGVAEVVGAGAEIVDLAGDDIERLVRVVERVRTAYPQLVISVATGRAEVARAGCRAGADLLRDAGGGSDPALVEVAAEFGAAFACPPAYAERAVAAGVARESVLVTVLVDRADDLDRVVATGWPVLVSLPQHELVTSTIAATAVCALAGARVYRVPHVTEGRQTVDMVNSIAGRRPPQRAIRGLQ
ncbi:dihydropteroate synthase [uncultured Nocardioides sp.]|uniref:dihydropteroate synthase n=1 Tax=uncultured Nocardioides sp. TaxID=198441 RepID=UPI0026302599|nr:dihydropteroate synthase [uncultured Nocardioides sp.]HRD62464.1 dihydropteroate synthase [Nocardioides sp.]